MWIKVLLILATVLKLDLAFELPSGAENILKNDVNNDFSCRDRPYGYYGDVANGCQLFHVCLPMEGRPPQQWTFVCNNGTIFDQQTLSCNYENDAFPCAQAEQLYGSVEFGKEQDDNDQQ